MIELPGAHFGENERKAGLLQRFANCLAVFIGKACSSRFAITGNRNMVYGSKKKGNCPKLRVNSDASSNPENEIGMRSPGW
jgi:hypothetical protein